MQSVDVLVRGAGAVGQCLALALARVGLRIALRDDVAPKPGTEKSADVRAYALNAASVELLRELEVWQALPPSAVTAVHEMQVHGDRPESHLEFTAWQSQVGALAWIVDAQALHAELDAAIRFAASVSRVTDDVAATLTALCEGKDSASRAALGVQVERFDFGQKAIAARLAASRDHQNVAHQWFRSPDVLALLPLDAPRARATYALVWSCPISRTEHLMALGRREFEAELAAELEQAGGAAVGSLTLCSERAAWPLTQATTHPWCGPGWVLLGDAAHVVHPLAGQGLNLGLADVAALARVLAQRESWRSLGDARLLRRYARERAGPTWAMGQLTGGLLQLFSHPAPTMRELRNRGLTLVDHLSPVKRWLNSRATHS
jgi:2-polyprenyl-6-methoxyphenol hydroxylase-like FAD-dependent oxidoreductase